MRSEGEGEGGFSIRNAGFLPVIGEKAEEERKAAAEGPGRIGGGGGAPPMNGG